MTNIQLPKIGLGTMTGRNAEAVDAYSEAIKMGFRLIDTAQIYFNEKTVGKAVIKSGVSRDNLIIASKVFVNNFSYKKVKKSTVNSLRKLGLEKIDIMYIHWPTGGYQKKMGEILKAFKELIEEGKIGYLGVSNFNIKILGETLEALDVYDGLVPIANQVEMHPWLQQKKLLEYVNGKNIKLVAYFPIMQGKASKVPELVEIAEKHGVSSTQVSLAWIMSKGVIPIPKSTNIGHLRDNFDSQNLNLDEEDLQKIDSIRTEKRFLNIPRLAPKWD